eukprot:SAG11_NODE_2574_length_3208_cov_1.487938_3_plen_34_part_01
MRAQTPNIEKCQDLLQMQLAGGELGSDLSHDERQ